MRSKVSFSKTVKEEIATNEYESVDRLKALLASFIRINGSLSFKNKETVINLKVENAKIAKFIYTTIKHFYGDVASLNYSRRTNLNKSLLYTITVNEKGQFIIDDLDISFLEGKISKDVVWNDDTIAGYLAGAFLAGGSVNSPATSNYHLEISLSSQNYAKWMLHLFNRFTKLNLTPKIVKRRENYVIYLKKSDQISEFLALIGATNACLEFESVRVERDTSNSMNRQQNFDFANMKRSFEAGLKQKEKIEMIDQVIGIENIRNINVRTLARLRLEYESASLADLASLMSDELNKEITRSSVYKWMKKIDEIYERIAK